MELTESKKIKNLNLVFTAINKNSGIVKMLKKRCDDNGINLIVVDPNNSSVIKTKDGHFMIRTATDAYKVSPKNTVVMPRHPVLMSSEGRNFLQSMEFYKFFVINNLASIDACEDKYTTDRILCNNNIETPKSVIVNVDDLGNLEDKVAMLGNVFPVVGKTLKGSLGIGVFICDSMMSLKSVLQMLSRIKPGQEIMLQQMINSDYDLRVHVYNKNYNLNCRGNISDYDIIGVMRRNKISNDFRSNFSLGATVETFEITEEQKEIAIKSAQAVGCRWCGVDIITDRATGENYVIEVNASPGLSGIESIYKDGGSPLDYIFTFLKNFISVTPDISVLGKEESAMVSIGDADKVLTTVTFDINRELSLIKIPDSDCIYDEKQNKLSFHFKGEYVTVSPDSTAYYNGGQSYIISGSVVFNNHKYNHVMFMVCRENEGEFVIMGNNFIGNLGEKVMIDVSTSYIVTDDPSAE